MYIYIDIYLHIYITEEQEYAAYEILAKDLANKAIITGIDTVPEAVEGVQVNSIYKNIYVHKHIYLLI
jgi:hypothetical protein